MYRCLNCGNTFETPSIKKTTYEDYYGVASLFPNHTPLELNICPRCGDDELEEFEEEEEEED